MTVVFKKRGAQDGAGSPAQGTSEGSGPAAATTLQVPQSDDTSSTGTTSTDTTATDATPPPAQDDAQPAQQQEQPEAEQSQAEQEQPSQEQQDEQPVKQEKAEEKAEEKAAPAKAEKQKKPRRKETKQSKDKDTSGSSGGSRSWSVNRVRTLVGRTIWLVFMVCAIVLALSAFMFALDFNDNNGLVNFLYGFADRVDLGVFDTDNPIRTFRTDGARDLTKITLLNYGIGAIVYLVVGRVLDRLIRP